MRQRIGVKACGFSLLELVLVSAIMVIFAAIAVPRYGTAAARHRIDLAARRVAADLSLARSYAKTTSSSRTVCFYPATDQYQLLNIPAPDGASGDYVVVLSAEPYQVDLVSASFNGSSEIAFNGWGLPVNGGTVTLSAGSQQRTITVNGETGQVGIQ